MTLGQHSLSGGALILLLACGLGIGCRGSANRSFTDTGAPHYRRAKLVYEIDSYLRPLPLSTDIVDAGSAQVDLAGDEPADEPAAAPWTVAQLSIDYPHPDGDTGRARAILRLTHDDPKGDGVSLASADTSSADHSEEVRILDFPKQQLDLLLTDLNGSGFFERQLRRGAGTFLDVRLDWGRTQKAWTPEPRLDHFVARVYEEGTHETAAPGSAASKSE